MKKTPQVGFAWVFFFCSLFFGPMHWSHFIQQIPLLDKIPAVLQLGSMNYHIASIGWGILNDFPVSVPWDHYRNRASFSTVLLLPRLVVNRWNDYRALKHDTPQHIHFSRGILFPSVFISTQPGGHSLTHRTSTQKKGMNSYFTQGPTTLGNGSAQGCNFFNHFYFFIEI